MGVAGSRGGRNKTSGVGGSRDKAMPGKMSLTRLIHSNCIGVSGWPMPSAVPAETTITSLRLVASKKCSDFWMLR